MTAGETPRPPLRPVSPRGGSARALRALVGRRPSPAEPWLADHPWRRAGALDEAARSVRLALAGGGFLTLFGSVVGAALLPQADGAAAWFVALVAGLLLAGGLGLIGVGMRTVVRRQRHGAVELRFTRFPYFLGEPLDATLVREGAAAPLDGLLTRLTCIEERLEWRPSAGDGPGQEQGLRRYERWCETRPVRGGAGSRTPVRFELPPPGPGVPGTRLASGEPVYWELEAWAALPGLDFHAVFLVPVYERPDPGPPGLR